MELIDGSGVDHAAMVKRIVEDSEREGSVVVGVVVFAKNDSTQELHTYIGSQEWPRDVEEEWPRLVAALARTVEDAKAQMANGPEVKVDGPGPEGAN